MTLEMKRVLEEYIGGGRNYRRIFDASYEEIYCRSFLILQQENQAREFMKDFFAELFMVLEDVTESTDAEFWFWEKYYGKIRKQYHRLLEAQVKVPEIGAPALAQILVGLPLLHRIMLLMSFHDGFKTEDIANMFGLAADKVQIELDKLEKMRPSLVKNQPEEISPYLGDWKVLLLGACNQLASATNNDWIEKLYQDSLTLANIPSTIQIPVEEIRKQTLETEKTFEEIPVQPEFTAPSPEKPQPQPEAYAQPEAEAYQPAYEPEEESYEPMGKVYDEPIEEAEPEEEDDSEEWSGGGSSWKMIVFGIVLALLIVAVVGFSAWKMLNDDEGGNTDQIQTEDSENDADLIIKGDDEEADADAEDVIEEEEIVEEEPVEEEEPLMMKVKGTDSRVNVRSEGSTNGSIVAKVVSGELVEVLGDPETEEWVLVHCTEQNDVEGYIKTEFLSYAE